MSKKQAAHFWHHIIDAHEARIKGLRNIRKQGLISHEEFNTFLEKASDELIYKIKEFRLREKLICWIFILTFPCLQVMNLSGDMARRLGRRRNEYEIVTEEKE